MFDSTIKAYSHIVLFQGAKQLVLKKRYRTPSIDQSFNTSGLPPTPLSPTTPLSPLETPTLNLRYQPVYQSSYELDLGSPHRSPYRRLSSESLSPSYSLRSPGTPTSSYASSPFPPSSGYQQLVTPLGYVPPSIHHSSIPTGPGYHQEPPIGIPAGPFGMPSPSRMVPLTPTPIGKQNSSPSLPSIPSAVGLPTSNVPPLSIPHSSSTSNITSNLVPQTQYRSTPSPMVQHNFHPHMARRQSSNDSVFTDSNPSPRENDPPPVPPRRRSSDKSLTKMDLKELEDFKSKGPGAPSSQSGPTTPTQEVTPMDTKPDENKVSNAVVKSLPHSVILRFSWSVEKANLHVGPWSTPHVWTVSTGFFQDFDAFTRDEHFSRHYCAIIRSNCELYSLIDAFSHRVQLTCSLR